MSKQRAYPTGGLEIITLPQYRRAVELLGGDTQCASLLGISKTTLHYRKVSKSLLTFEASLAICALLDHYQIDRSAMDTEDEIPICMGRVRRRNFCETHNIEYNPKVNQHVNRRHTQTTR